MVNQLPYTQDTHRDVFISSTTEDLKNHRKATIDAVWRASMYPRAMERDTAAPLDAVDYSLNLVERSEIYIGIFAHRYGYVPEDKRRNPNGLSITEMEYRAAMELRIPILIFIMDEEHPIRAGDIEIDPVKLQKLNALKTELKDRHVVGFFRSVEDLARQVFQALKSTALEEYLSKQENAPLRPVRIVGRKAILDDENGTHPNVKLIPDSPQPYYAHPYILTHDFVGRESELTTLDKWVLSSENVMVIEAIGGVGKSALAWEWVQRKAKETQHDFGGMIWWSFYENNSELEHFIHHALVYVNKDRGFDIDEVKTRLEREQILLKELQEKCYLLVLDGIERILMAYHRLDTSHFDEDKIDFDKHLRSCVDANDDEFLKKLVGHTRSKILISTRLTPQSLLGHTRELVRGVQRINLRGLTADDALVLMRQLGVQGDSGNLKNFMAQFDNHSLMLGVLAGRIMNYPPAPGNFDQWYMGEGRRLKLTEYNLQQRRHHILKYAFDGLTLEQSNLLSQISTFRYPVDYDTLSELNPYLIGSSNTESLKEQSVDAKGKLHIGLIELEERGLLLWDRKFNRYDLHPIVRSYAFDQMEESDRNITLERMRNHFATLPPENIHNVQKLSDLKRSLELYEVLIRSTRWDDAIEIYDQRLKYALQYKLAAYDKIIELLTPFFGSGFDELPRLSTWRGQNICMTDVATAFYYLGQLEQSQRLRVMKIKLALSHKKANSLGVALRTYSSAIRLEENKLAVPIKICELALRVGQVSKDKDGMAMTSFYLLNFYRDIGWWKQAEEAYHNFQQFIEVRSEVSKWRTAVERSYAELALYQGQDASDIIERAWKLSQQNGTQNSVEVREIYRLRGEAALQRGQYNIAADFFQDTITLARRSGLSVAGLMGRLAYARVRQELYNEAKLIIQEALEQQTKGHIYDLYSSAAEVYFYLGEPEAAREYAMKSYLVAWADGVPYSWWWQLERAKRVLEALRVDYPDLPQFNSSKIEKAPYEDEILSFIEELEHAKIVVMENSKRKDL